MRGLAFLLIAAARGFAQDQAQDPAIDRLLAAPERADIRWAISIPSPTLTAFQRLSTRISIRVDGKEIAKREGKGEFLFAAEFKDSAHRTYRTQSRVNLQDYEKATSSQELECALQIFVLPGNYDLSLIVLEPATEKFSVAHRTLHVAPLSNDPLPDLWKRLRAVDFIDIPDAPDRWFLPGERGRLFLEAAGSGARLEILANITPTETSRRQGRTYGRNMDVIVPALKILSRIEGVSKNVTVVDVARRRVTYEQHEARDVNWEAMKQGLGDPNKIAAAELKDREKNAQFFATEAVRRAKPENGRLPVLIVLSGPVTFTTHQEMRPIDAPPNARVFYLRFQTIMPASLIATQPALRSGPRPPEIMFPRITSDELQRTLKALQPRVFDLYSAMDFRKALAAILREIGQ